MEPTTVPDLQEELTSEGVERDVDVTTLAKTGKKWNALLAAEHPADKTWVYIKFYTAVVGP